MRWPASPRTTTVPGADDDGGVKAFEGWSGAGRSGYRVVVQLVFLVSTVFGDDAIGRAVRTFFLRRVGADLAAGVSVHGGGFISHPHHLTVGAGSFISRNCFFDLEAQLVLGDRVTVGHGTSFITTRHKLGPAEQRCGDFGGVSITIGDGAWLGANVTVLPGVQIGDGAVVAAGSVVTDDVAPNSVVAGVPARPRKTLQD